VLHSVHIENFRALREFRMSGLGRVNLLVGTNNCGKTSVLEAIHILASPGRTRGIWNALLRRHETIERTIGDLRQVEAAVANVVHGHRIQEGPAFAIAGSDAGVDSSVVASFQLTSEAIPDAGDQDEEIRTPLKLHLEWNRGTDAWEMHWPLTRRGGLPFRPSKVVTKVSPDESESDQIEFITTEGLPREKVITLLEDVMLTEEEASILHALRTIEPAIEGIAPVGSDVAVKVGGRRIPIGSMGDGVWHLLSLALALGRARGGTLLVDEIDTGLHYTVLTQMWRLVFEAATRLDVQVFATTHSRDCYEALGEVVQPDRDDVSLQRIESGRSEAIAYTAAMVRIAAERGLEVR
jgi:hypothetical protein